MPVAMQKILSPLMAAKFENNSELTHLLDGIQRQSTNGNEAVEQIRDFFKKSGLNLSDANLWGLVNELQKDLSADVKVVNKMDPKGILSSGKIHPDFAKKIEAFLSEAKAEGLPIFLWQGYRSPQEQDKLFNSGKGVTNARGGKSFHNYGLAVDVVFDNGKGGPSWDNQHNWQRLGELGKKFGLTWGGDFKRIKDLGHFEFHSSADLR